MERKHRDLPVWQAAVELVPLVYRMTAGFPREEVYGLAAQMRRAAVSVPSNIAEGAARSGPNELLHFLSMASASLSELDTHVEIARRLGYLKDDGDDMIARMDDLGGQLVRIRSRLRQRRRPA